MMWLWTVLLGAAVAAAAEGDTTAGATQSAAPRVVLVPVNVTDTALVERLRSFAEVNTGLKIAVADAVTYDGEDARKALELAIARARSNPRDGVVVLAGSRLTTNAHGFYDPELRGGLVNLPALAAGIGSDAEKYGRRAERQVMRIIGMLAGLGPCPNPRCVMYPYRNLGELDEIGRNFCPPCLGKLEKGIEAQGFALRPSSAAVPVTRQVPGRGDTARQEK